MARKGDNHTNQDAIKSAIDAKLRALYAKVTKQDVHLNHEEMVEIEDLTKLYKSCDAESVATRRKIFLISLFLVILILLSVLLNKVQSTNVEVAITTRSISFATISAKPILFPFAISSIALSSRVKVILPSGNQIGSIYSNNSYFKLATNKQGSDATAPAYLSVDLSNISQKDAFRIFRTPQSDSYHLSYCSVSEPIKLNFRGTVSVKAGGKELPIKSARPDFIELVIQSGYNGSKVCERGDLVEMEFIPSNRMMPIFNSNLAISSLSFLDLRKTGMRLRGDYLPISAIEKGEIIFHEFAGNKVAVNKHQRLELDGVDGIIRTISIDNKGDFSILFEGQVANLMFGPSNNQYSLMPNYLEWLRNREELVLLWSSSISLFGLVLAFLRWFWK